jgi:hypothetical protein
MTIACDDADVIRARALGIAEYEPIPPLPGPVYEKQRSLEQLEADILARLLDSETKAHIRTMERETRWALAALTLLAVSVVEGFFLFWRP